MLETNAVVIQRAIGTPGIGELIIILVIVLLIFGPGKIPALGDAIGRGIKNFRRSFRGQEDIDVTPKKPALPEETQKPAEQPPAQTPASAAPSVPQQETREKIER